MVRPDITFLTIWCKWLYLSLEAIDFPCCCYTSNFVVYFPISSSYKMVTTWLDLNHPCDPSKRSPICRHLTICLSCLLTVYSYFFLRHFFHCLSLWGDWLWAGHGMVDTRMNVSQNFGESGAWFWILVNWWISKMFGGGLFQKKKVPMDSVVKYHWKLL